MRKIIWLSLVVCTTFSAVQGQSSRQDSIVKAAKTDAKKFRLDDTTFKKYKRSLPATSDYFKPNDTVPKNPSFITDSAYVQAYRKAAYQQNRHRRTPWHYVWIGATVTAGLAISGVVALLIAIGPNMN